MRAPRPQNRFDRVDVPDAPVSGSAAEGASAASGSASGMASDAAAGVAPDAAVGATVLDFGELAALRRRTAAQEAISHHMLGAAGVAVVPVPVLDALGVAALQLHLLRRLCDIYGVAYSEKRGRSVLLCCAQGLGLTWLGMAVGTSVMKVLPGLGLWAGIGSFGVLMGGSTYALGTVIERHFARGGTLDDIIPAEYATLLREQYERGRALVRRAMRPDMDDIEADARGDTGKNTEGRA